MGDARLTLARETQKAKIVIIDAFASDAIPVHLLTREALAVYLSKLEDRGVLVFHISNKVMDLTQTVARAGAEFGLTAFRRIEITPLGADPITRTSSMAMALARDASDLGSIAKTWERITPVMERAPWTDDYSSIIQPLRDMYEPAQKTARQ